jgi:hypothetical protein
VRRAWSNPCLRIVGVAGERACGEQQILRSAAGSRVLVVLSRCEPPLPRHRCADERRDDAGHAPQGAIWVLAYRLSEPRLRGGDKTGWAPPRGRHRPVRWAAAPAALHGHEPGGYRYLLMPVHIPDLATTGGRVIDLAAVPEPGAWIEVDRDNAAALAAELRAARRAVAAARSCLDLLQLSDGRGAVGMVDGGHTEFGGWREVHSNIVNQPADAGLLGR